MPPPVKKTKLHYFSCLNVDPFSDISVLHFKHEFGHYKHPEQERHVRNFYKITFVAKGNGTLFCNDREFPVMSGSLFLTHPDDLTSCRIHSKYLEVYDVIFKGNLLREYQMEPRNILPILTAGFRPAADSSHLLILNVKKEIPRLIRLMYEEMSQSSVEHQKIEQLYLNALLLHLEREWRKHNRPKNSEKFVVLVREAIESCFASGLDFQALAKKAGVSSAHLGRVFHRVSGMSISGALKEKRLLYAADQLRHTGDPVNKIIFRSGFRDPSTFFYEFQKKFGITPAAYRKNGSK